MHKPTDLNWQPAKHLMHYLKQTMQYDFHFHKFLSTSIQAFSNLDWADSRDDRLSTGGYCIFLGDNFLS